MKVEELIIDGFKSYATRTVISDWDPQFNAITGLNGSGKSNILDAICFVLGISSMSTVRASNLQDLIYKRGQAGVTKASITIVFDNSDKSNCPIGFKDSPKISVTRQIVLGGTSKYLVNGHRAPQQTVLQLFQSVQLNINNPNFLIMQGKITKVLNMKPTEILSLIEEAAGTKMYEDRREKAERTMGKKEEKLQENRSLLAEEIEPKLLKLKQEKRMFLEFQTTQADLEKLTRVIHAFDFYHMKQRYETAKDTMENGEKRMADIEIFLEKTKNEIESLSEDLDDIKNRKRSEIEKDGKLSQLEKREGELLDQTSRLNTTLSICANDFFDYDKKVQSLTKSTSKMSSDLEKQSDAYKSIEMEYNNLNDELEKLKTEHKQKSELLSTLSTGISSSGGTDNGYTEQLVAIKHRLNEFQVDIKKKKMRIEMMNRERDTNQPKLKEAEEERKKLELNIQELENNCTTLTIKLSKFGFDPNLLQQLKSKENSLQNEIYQVSSSMENLRRRMNNLDFQYSKPYPDFNTDAVKGVAAQLFAIKKEHLDSATALQVCAGGRLYNVVVEDEKIASALLQKGRLRKRVTIIPLNKIATRVVNDKVLKTAKTIAPGSVDLALNLIGYEEDVSSAMKFIFGGSLICKDAETAKKVTFNPNVRTRSITLEGDVYDPEGTLSGGSRNISNSLLLDIQKYNEINYKLAGLENELLNVKEQIQQQSVISQKTKSLQNELNIAQHKLGLAKKSYASNSATQLIKRNQEIDTEIESCNSDIEQNESEMNVLCGEIKKIERDADEFANNKGAKLEELKNEVQIISDKISKLNSTIESKYDTYQNMQLDIEQLESGIKSNSTLIQQSNGSLDRLKQKKVEIEADIAEAKKSLDVTQAELADERRRLFEIDEEVKELEDLIKNKKDLISQNELEAQKIKNDINDYRNNSKNLQKRLEELVEEFSWLSDFDMVNGIVAQHEGINLSQFKERASRLEENYKILRPKVNPNIMSMIENVEKKESALKTMINTIEKDKLKIKETITKLNEYKRETLVKTWEIVNKDFGLIFADLLPNSFAKLVPSEGKDVTEGLEVKVKLGSIWKESLVELSGGQRSLIALSLIMALLQFRPAPMYILDEVDSALDLSHTQNIGHLIKTRFKGAQFIVVSLKEGMFTNANRVFRTRFQDGISVVSLM
ncbi:Structural maintenance of chromosomes protein 2 [Maudiozyma exigua]|uniref:Structural maintenance of chromosomes protein n=1 Tax=Maudiozyma exigua TaxID=34358 RepID=A0A9P6VX60_MAUEX|nr:Structural maintenance of chromosomes protein 2 [Kazachstania exigua]